MHFIKKVITKIYIVGNFLIKQLINIRQLGIWVARR